ncbi:helix-turn-helix domain-containing protein [Caulobacter sp. RL271]|uniref:Helix-turn-helix domain-containing protein n=1 Tax=Caulobacter segnis TaxID=88688 RepID=A0ABY4ZPF7_9CAUL|nr:helix-turn-helix domain-containing protein [Caulobacter segnis]USQ94468.1 helix-turn-helix domain-containing protein [Caulobacter segnis]
MPVQYFQDPGGPAATRRAEAAFEALAHVQRFEPGEEIYGQEAPTEAFYKVVSGVVRGACLISDGRRQVAAFYFPDDMFGLEIGVSHRQAAEALTRCEVQIVKRRALAVVDAGAQIERMIWRVTSQQLERAQERSMLLARRNAYEKVACFLIEIAERGPGPWASLPMCRQDIADYLGLTIETVSRMLTQLQHDGLICLDGSRRFQIVRLRQLASSLAA